MAYLALAEGPINPANLDDLVGAPATDAAWQAARHLLVRDYQGAWSIFHNSFRLFLRAQTGLRHGLTDEAAVRRRYAELADTHFTRSVVAAWFALLPPRAVVELELLLGAEIHVPDDMHLCFRDGFGKVRE